MINKIKLQFVYNIMYYYTLLLLSLLITLQLNSYFINATIAPLRSPFTQMYIQRSQMHHLQHPEKFVHKQNQQKQRSAESDQLMYPFDENDYMNEINSMRPLHDQPLSFRLPFYGFQFHYIWIHRDGYATFNKGLRSYKFPVSFPAVPADTRLEEDPSMIAVWFAHQDIPNDIPDAGVYFRVIEMAKEDDEELRDRIIHDFTESMPGAIAFDVTHVIIITWKNMTFANVRPDRALKTNTYQMVIATNEINTIVMYNYEWISWITHLDNYDGLNGPPAYVGFNAGNSTLSFEFAPFSQNARVSLLPTMGFGNGMEGRYYFQVDEVLYQGACIDKELDPNLPDRMGMTTSTNFVQMIGGQVLNVTGPCVTPNSIIHCRFDIWKVPGKYMTPNIIACVVPQMMFEGYIDLTVTVDDNTFFYSRLYIQSPETRKMFDVNILEMEILDKIPTKDGNDEFDTITIQWDSVTLSWVYDHRATISLWGYRENSENVYPSLSFIVNLVEGTENDGEFKINIHDLPKIQLSRYDFTFGFISINITGESFSPVLWSRPMPLAWFLSSYWEHEYGINWNERFCTDWFNNEKESDRFATTVFRCPCTVQQSDLDRGRFAPDLQCNVIDKKCDALHHGAQHCVRTARPSVGGSGQTCCYDDYGELLQSADTMYGGRPSRTFVYGKHPFKMRMMTPTFSYWLYDIMPFYYCCKWSKGEDNSESCQMLNYWRTSQDCSSYQPPAIASIFGDPHIVTFDRLNYTFKAKGEFVLAHVDNPVHKLDIHARFEQMSQQINATHLTAVAMRDNVSSIVEIRLRPVASRWQFQMYLIADKEYYHFWDANLRSLNLKGVTLYQPAGIRNMSHIIAMFDSGAGVEVIVTAAGSLQLNVYLPHTYLNITRGILGKWSRDKSDDFELPDGSPGPSPNSMSMRDIHQYIIDHWRLVESSQPYIGQSLFWHDVVPYSVFDDRKFEPKFDISDHQISETDLDRVCSQSAACVYDYVVTGDADYAAHTRKSEAAAEIMHRELSKEVIRCPALPKPQNGRKSENRYWPGTIVRFSCDEGYRLVGYEVRRCREDGLWSWGVDPECIADITFGLTLSGLFIAIAITGLVFLSIGICCFIRIRKSNKTVELQQPLIRKRESFDGPNNGSRRESVNKLRNYREQSRASTGISADFSADDSSRDEQVDDNGIKSITV